MWPINQCCYSTPCIGRNKAFQSLSGFRKCHFQKVPDLHQKLSLGINPVHRIILTICEYIFREDALLGGDHAVRVYKPPDLGIIIPALKVIEPCLVNLYLCSKHATLHTPPNSNTSLLQIMESALSDIGPSVIVYDRLHKRIRNRYPLCIFSRYYR